MFPNVFTELIITENEEKEKEETGVDFLFDYTTGQHIMKGSVLAECDGQRKVKQFIENVLRTPANLYKDYVKGEKESFGLSIYNYLGERSLPMGYINSELKREMTEHLLKHPMIAEVRDWKAKREKRGLNVSFTAVLKDGSVVETSKTVGVSDV